MSEQALAMPTVNDLDPSILESLVTNGDCSKLNPLQRVSYYRSRCEAAGLDYRTQPLQFINLQGKLILYALKGATDQLAANHGIVCEIIDQRTENDVRTVTVRSKTKDGRQTDEVGCVAVKGKQGDDLCNALMKAVTKAKRRAVLSICGLGMLDETELETIKAVGAGSVGGDSRPTAPAPVVPVVRQQEAVKQMENALNKESPPYAGYQKWPRYFVFWIGTAKAMGKGTSVGIGLSPNQPVGGKQDPDGFFANVWTSNDGGGERLSKLMDAKKENSPVHVDMETKENPKNLKKPYKNIVGVEHDRTWGNAPKQAEFIDPPVDHEGPQDEPPDMGEQVF